MSEINELYEIPCATYEVKTFDLASGHFCNRLVSSLLLRISDESRAEFGVFELALPNGQFVQIQPKVPVA